MAGQECNNIVDNVMDDFMSPCQNFAAHLSCCLLLIHGVTKVWDENNYFLKACVGFGVGLSESDF